MAASITSCPVSAADLAIMRRIDELHLDYPFAGSRMLRDLLAWRGHRDRARAGHDDDAADGDRGDLPPAAYVTNPQRAQGFSLPAALA